MACMAAYLCLCRIMHPACAFLGANNPLSQHLCLCSLSAMLQSTPAADSMKHLPFPSATSSSHTHSYKSKARGLCLSARTPLQSIRQCSVNTHTLWFCLTATLLACRNALGKLGSPVLCRGHLSLLKTELLTAGQSRACLHHDIHSIRCNRGDAPVTLVVRHKDQCAMTRVTNFFMPDDEVANDGSWNVAWEDDRPCSHTEKTSMLKVNMFTTACSCSWLLQCSLHVLAVKLNITAIFPCHTLPTVWLLILCACSPQCDMIICTIDTKHAVAWHQLQCALCNNALTLQLEMHTSGH